MPDMLSQKNKWGLSLENLDRLLACLDVDREQAGAKYELLHNKLILYFECRDCPFPEAHADETLDRLARKLAAGEIIREPATYLFGIARMLRLEIAREQSREQTALAKLARNQTQPENEEAEAGQRLECFRHCLNRACRIAG